jgi:hypothetical protein
MIAYDTPPPSVAYLETPIPLAGEPKIVPGRVFVPVSPQDPALVARMPGTDVMITILCDFCHF